MARETARGRHASQRISRLCYELDTSRLNPLSPLRSPADLADPSLKQDATLRAGLGASKLNEPMSEGGSAAQRVLADPLTTLLAPAATRLACVQPDDKAPEKAAELNPGKASAGPRTASDGPLQQPPVQRMDAPPQVPAAEQPLPDSRSSQGEEAASVGFSGRQTSIQARVLQFKGAIERSSVDLKRLRALARHGIPDREALRATAWKLLLNYLPPETQLWPQFLAEKRAAYRVFCKELVVVPQDRGAKSHKDHPLSQHNDSRWAAFFKDAEMMEQIDRDVMRTHPDMHFFSGSDRTAQTHREEMKRVLFIFAKLNPGLRYVQGMNELLAPLYYQFRNDPGAREDAEPDSFYCFMDIIAEFRDHFCQQLDNSKVGIRATLSKLSDLLKEKDLELWHHLQIRNKVNPQFYAFRWITLLLTQEFSFPDSVRLWDTLFSDPAGRYDCLLRLCCAMLINIREELLKGDFSQNLKMLQRYPPVDVHAILHRAASL